MGEHLQQLIKSSGQVTVQLNRISVADYSLIAFKEETKKKTACPGKKTKGNGHGQHSGSKSGKKNCNVSLCIHDPMPGVGKPVHQHHIWMNKKHPGRNPGQGEECFPVVNHNRSPGATSC